MKKLISITVVLFMLSMTSCLKDKIDDDQQDLTNQQQMRQLVIEDPSIWNSLANQSIDLNSFEEAALKSATSAKEYPSDSKKYYFAIFEDLYPAEGDYDFNDVILRSKLILGKKGSTVSGSLNTTLINRGGALPLKLGVMFYENSGKKYTRIANENIKVNGQQLTAGGQPWSTDLSSLGEEWVIDYECKNSSDNIWISYFIISDKSEILTGGFGPTSLESFEVPHPQFLNDRNLPWGLEIEAKSFNIPNEKELFLNCYPDFKEWAESDGKKNKKWYESPSSKHTH